MSTYPVSVSYIKPGISTGRMAVVTRETLSELTPTDILEYINEGFILVEEYFRENAKSIEHSFVGVADELAQGANFELYLYGDWIASSPDYDVKFEVFEE